MIRRARWGVLAAGAFLAASCGWHAGVAAPAGVRTVGVEVFGNLTPEPDLEPRLSTALADAVARFVSTDLVAPRGADAVVTGAIVEFRRRMGVRSTENELLETGVRIAVVAELVHRASGRVLRRTERHVWSDYALGGREEDRRAVDRALGHLAERVVLDLFRPVAYEAPEPEESAGPGPMGARAAPSRP